MDAWVTESHVAMVRGVRNCSRHGEENLTSPAILFAQTCSFCAGEIFRVIWSIAFHSGAACAAQQKPFPTSDGAS